MKKFKVTEELKNEAEFQILEMKEPVSYDTREYPVEVLVEKFKSGEFLIPTYQRDFVWKKDVVKMSKLIESIILDLPIPYLFFADDNETGKLEIVDGSQRIRTLTAFCGDEFALKGLEVLDLLNGFKYTDLLESRQRRFMRKTLRSIELTEKSSQDTRRDLFARINTKPYDLLPMEVRKGSFDGEFYKFLVECSKSELFNKLCPISKERLKRGEAEELILRFFALSDNYEQFVHRVDDFLDEYMKSKHDGGFDKLSMKEEFTNTLSFIDKHFPYGFRKSEKFSSTPRVRFEAIAVGTNLALRVNSNLTPNNLIEWLESEDFQNIVTSDGANNKSKVIRRIEFVRDNLLNN